MGEIPQLDLDAVEDSGPSCEFTLVGRTWHCRNRDDIPFAAMVPLVQLSGSTDVGKVLVQIGPIMEALLVPGEADDFLAVLNDPRSPLTIARMTKLIEFLVTEVVGGGGERPTKPSLGSAPGRLPTGHTSEDDSFSPDTASEASVG